MATLSGASPLDPEVLRRRLRFIGTCSAFLALAILGASMLLRLATELSAGGEAFSTLPATLEGGIRLIHRLAASGAGILAIWAVFLYATNRAGAAQWARPIAWAVAATVILAIIGPLTPGYRLHSITVANVAGGMVLLMAWWWLREATHVDPDNQQPADPLLRAALLVFLAHIATGALASANEMHDIRWVVVFHLGTALLASMFIGAAAWSRLAATPASRCALTAAALLLIQLALGFTLPFLSTRPLWLAFAHGLLSPLLGMALVSLVVRK